MQVKFDTSTKYVFAWLLKNEVGTDYDQQLDQEAKSMGYKVCRFVSGDGDLSEAIGKIVSNHA